jgi:hypothetical protein
MTATRSTVEAPDVAAAQAAGLRRLADLIEANPELAGTSSYMRALNIWWATGAEHLAALARAGLDHGATVEKVVHDDLYSLALRWGPVTAHALADRGNVCERVVLGVEEVTRSVPDPDALAAVPLVEKTETVERVEWRCPPLLAGSVAGGAR